MADGVPYTSQRVDAEHTLDLFVSVGEHLSPGLVLLCDAQPPSSPDLDAVEITTHLRADGRWALGIWLNSPELHEVFAQLCDDLVESSREVAPSQAAVFVLVRIGRWRRLLEPDKGGLSVSEIRGLIGELLVLQRLSEHWPTDQVVAGWIGPHESPQDFVLPELRIEVKVIVPSSRAVKILVVRATRRG